MERDYMLEIKKTAIIMTDMNKYSDSGLSLADGKEKIL